jgi:hypothetical protein
MCFELGLHKKSTYALSSTNEQDHQALAEREELEIKSRCFWCVLAMDRVASFVLGRPLAIQLEDVDAELPYADTSKLDDPRGFSSSNEGFDSPKWHLKTSVFVHIVRYRIICGKILTSLHRDNKSVREATLPYESIRDGLARELEEWHADTSKLPLITATTSSSDPHTASSFRSKEWHELLYHNGILMLFRPSKCLSDASQNSHTLQYIFDSSQRSINLYAYLHRSRKINYSWVTLHSVFIAGISYIYALRYHYQNVQKPHSQNEPPRSKLNSTPTINQVVNDTRACSNVLVAVSERWSTARNCSQVFDKLSDAVLSDVVEATRTTTGISVQHPVQQDMPPNTVDMTPNFAMPPPLPATNMPSAFSNMAVDSILQDCFGDLQNLCTDQYGNDAIAQLSQDWLFGIENVDTGYW